MNKSELLNGLQDAYRQWDAFIGQIDPADMDQPGVAGHWSIKDIVAHMAGWQRRNNIRMQAALRGEPVPASPWPADIKTDDEVNAWLYEANRGRSAGEVRADAQAVVQQLLAIVQELPDDIEIEPAYHLLWLNGQRFSASEFFDHFRDDHEPDVRAWLARVKKQ